MAKYTRTAFTSQGPAELLAEIMHAANLKDLPFHNGDLHSRHHAVDHPDKVRITVTVERVSPLRKGRYGLNTMGYDAGKTALVL